MVSLESTYPNNIKMYEKQFIIGNGAFGSVWEARIIAGNHKDELVAIKEVNLEDLEEKCIQNLNNELSVMTSLKHETLLKSHIELISGHILYIVMPLMNAGSLQNIMQFKYPGGITDESIIATILKEILQSLDYLHKNKLIHRDIKSGNILLDMNGNISLGDFGVATYLKEGRKKNSFVGSFCHMAPEIVSSYEGYDVKVDIWSIGITAIEIAQGKPPYQGLNQMEILRKIQLGEPQTLKYTDKWDPCFVSFIKDCLVKDPSKRPDCETLLKNNEKFFAKAKDSTYIKEKLLKGVPNVIERFGKFNQFQKKENELKKESSKIIWDLDEEDDTKQTNINKMLKDTFNDEDC